MRDYIGLVLILVTAYVGIFFVGNYLYLGVLYYFLSILGIGIVCWIVRPKAYFATGAGIAFLISVAIYSLINLSKERPEGLLGLGHLASLPGAYVMLLLGGAWIKRKLQSSGLQLAEVCWFFTGLILFAMGFFINQLIVCNTVMYCGRLSVV